LNDCGKAWAEFLDKKTNEVLGLILRCKQWKCPDCARKNASALRTLLIQVLKAYLDSRDQTAPKLKYHHKLVTLTLPGAFWRSNNPPDQADKIMKKNLKRFLEWMRKHRGIKLYFWVREIGKDGYPHIHLLMLGPGVADKDFLKACTDLWEKKFDMGDCDVDWKEGIVGAVTYLTKYVTKGCEGSIARSRVFSISQSLLKLLKVARQEKKQEVKKRFVLLRLFTYNPQNGAKRLLVETEALTAMNLENFFDHVHESALNAGLP
jgi:hypothetical protein